MHPMDPTLRENRGGPELGACLRRTRASRRSGSSACPCVRGEVALVAVDSAAALTPLAELERAIGDQTIGLQVRMTGRAMRQVD